MLVVDMPGWQISDSHEFYQVIRDILIFQTHNLLTKSDPLSGKSQKIVLVL